MKGKEKKKRKTKSLVNIDDIKRCRDIKLENIFIGADGQVKLGDFGLTMSMKQEVAISPVGTVEYMAPEVKIIHLASCKTSDCLPFTFASVSCVFAALGSSQ